MSSHVSKSEEIIALQHSEGKEEVYFNEYLAIIESVLLSDEFCDAQEEFFLTNCDQFVESTDGELSHDCITVFQRYCLWVEKIIEVEVQKRNVSLNIAQFIALLQGQISQLQGEVFDTLYSMADFTHFQNTMQQYRRLKWSKSSEKSIAPKRSASASSIRYERLDECLTVTPMTSARGDPKPTAERLKSIPSSAPDPTSTIIPGTISKMEPNGTVPTEGLRKGADVSPMSQSDVLRKKSLSELHTIERRVGDFNPN